MCHVVVVALCCFWIESDVCCVLCSGSSVVVGWGVVRCWYAVRTQVGVCLVRMLVMCLLYVFMKFV